jgi:hypothetical protein
MSILNLKYCVKVKCKCVNSALKYGFTCCGCLSTFVTEVKLIGEIVGKNIEQVN